MIRSFFVSVGSLVGARAYLAISQVAVLPILAAYLSVEDFALMAIAMTVVLFSIVLSDGGIGRSLIRVSAYDAEEWSSVFWFLNLLGLGLALAVCAMAPLWAWVFANPDIVPALLAMSVIPVANAAAATPTAELERRERYVVVARLQIAATTLGLLLAVGMAIGGYGVWALIAQQIALAATRCAGAMWISAFRARRVFLWSKVQPHLNFATNSIATSLVSTLQTQFAVMAIGYALGQTALGHFAMAMRFNRLPMFGLAGPASSVVFVRMSQVKDSPEKVARIYHASVRLLALALIPPIIMLIFSSQAVFTWMLGEKWALAATVFSLSIGGFMLDAAALVTLASLFRARDRTDLLLGLELRAMVLCIVLISAAVLISLEAAALMYLVQSVIKIEYAWRLAQRCAPVDPWACRRALAAPLAVGFAFALLYLAITEAAEPPLLGEVALAASLALAALGASALATRGPLREALAPFRQPQALESP